jgi:hypothetical protein
LTLSPYHIKKTTNQGDAPLSPAALAKLDLTGFKNN